MRTYNKIIELIFLISAILSFAACVYIMFTQGFKEGLYMSVIPGLMFFWYLVRRIMRKKLERIAEEKAQMNQKQEAQ